MTSYRDENDIIGAVRPNMKCLRRRHKIKDLLKRERRCLADPNYLTLKQNNKITSLMRSIALDWIFELVDTTDGSSMSLYPTACCMFDKYLSVETVCPEDLQDVALTALIASSKVLKTDTPLTISKTLENYIRLSKLKKIEEQFLNAVKIDPEELVLPTDFFYSYISRISEEYTMEVVRDILYHSYTLLPVIYTEYESVLHPPSVIAGASVLESVTRLLGPEEGLSTLHHIVNITNLHPSYLVKATRDLRTWITKMMD